MLLKISHTTTYSYDQPVVYALQKVRLRPQRVKVQTVVDWNVAVSGALLRRIISITMATTSIL